MSSRTDSFDETEYGERGANKKGKGRNKRGKPVFKPPKH